MVKRENGNTIHLTVKLELFVNRTKKQCTRLVTGKTASTKYQLLAR
ncbi:MAG: hypothetical protein ACLU70_01615 [Lachnospira sp.]